MLGIQTPTLARWEREGVLTTSWTPGGHRRYRRRDVRRLLADLRELAAVREDASEAAARLYDEGWSISQVAAKFDLTYRTARRRILKHTTLRSNGKTR